MNGPRWRVVAEWAPGLIWAPKGDLEVGNVEPHYFRTLYTHTNQLIYANKFNVSKKITRELAALSHHTKSQVSARANAIVQPFQMSFQRS